MQDFFAPWQKSRYSKSLKIFLKQTFLSEKKDLSFTWKKFLQFDSLIMFCTVAIATQQQQLMQSLPAPAATAAADETRSPLTRH